MIRLQVLSQISSKAMVMQFGVTNEPWEGGTELTASSSSHLSKSSSSNLKLESLIGLQQWTPELLLYDI